MACTTMYDPCFVPASQIGGLRMLGVRVDPPEVLYDPRTLAVEGPVFVRALLAYPLPVPDALTLRARVCGRTVEGGRCAAEVPWVAAALGDQQHLPELLIEIPAAAIAEARAADPLQGYSGARITIDVEGNGGGETIAATKVLVAGELGAAQPPNHGFEISGLVVRHGTGREEAVVPGRPVQVDVGETVGLIPRLSPGIGAMEAAEEYDTVDLSGRAVRLRERISYSFFVTPHAQFGRLGRPEAGADVADEPAPGGGAGEGLVLLTALEEGSGRVFVVARDGRGAEAFYAFDVERIERRSCFRGDRETKCAALEVGCQ